MLVMLYQTITIEAVEYYTLLDWAVTIEADMQLDWKKVQYKAHSDVM